MSGKFTSTEIHNNDNVDDDNDDNSNNRFTSTCFVYTISQGWPVYCHTWFTSHSL